MIMRFAKNNNTKPILFAYPKILSKDPLGFQAYLNTCVRFEDADVIVEGGGFISTLLFKESSSLQVGTEQQTSSGNDFINKF